VENSLSTGVIVGSEGNFCLFFSLKKFAPLDEETVIGNNDKVDPLHSNCEVIYTYMPVGCSIISYNHYQWYLICADESTVVVNICYFYPLLLAPYRR